MGRDRTDTKLPRNPRSRADVMRFLCTYSIAALLWTRSASLIVPTTPTFAVQLRNPAVFRFSKRAFPAMALSGGGTSQYALICNGEEQPCDFNSESFLLKYPRGPYTTARTHLLNNVFEFEFHNKRIAESTALMVEAGTLRRPEAYTKLSDPVALRDEYLANTRAAVQLFRSRSGGGREAPADGARAGARRPAERTGQNTGVNEQGLWTSRAENVHEVVLCDDAGHLYEGLSSNFFVITQPQNSPPVVQTAGEGVLLGTVRGLALQLCSELGIKVEETGPQLKDLDKWEEVFISSTSRWVLPVGEVVLPGGETWRPKSCGRTQALYKSVLDHALQNSTPL